MKRFNYSADKRFPYSLVILTYTIYVAAFVAYHDRLGIGIAALATIPVMAASWYFGIKGGLLIAILSILSNLAVLVSAGNLNSAMLNMASDIIGFFTLLLVGFAVGLLGNVIRERKETLIRLQKIEAERQAYTNFLELLNSITSMALEADSLDSTLHILVEEISKLFKADDGFFSLWDESRRVPIPVTAHGSMRDIYPYVQFEPGEVTLTTSVMEACRPIAILDIENSQYISPKIAAIFPSRSMLGLPLIAQHRKLGALLLGYNHTRFFDENDLAHAQMTAEQVALVLSKSSFWRKSGNRSDS